MLIKGCENREGGEGGGKKGRLHRDSGEGKDSWQIMERATVTSEVTKHRSRDEMDFFSFFGEKEKKKLSRK